MCARLSVWYWWKKPHGKLRLQTKANKSSFPCWKLRWRGTHVEAIVPLYSVHYQTPSAVRPCSQVRCECRWFNQFHRVAFRASFYDVRACVFVCIIHSCLSFALFHVLFSVGLPLSLSISLFFFSFVIPSIWSQATLFAHHTITHATAAAAKQCTHICAAQYFSFCFNLLIEVNFTNSNQHSAQRIRTGELATLCCICRRRRLFSCRLLHMAIIIYAIYVAAVSSADNAIFISLALRLEWLSV